MSTKLEIDIKLSELVEEAGHEIVGLQFLHAWQTYAGVKVCEELHFFEDPEVGGALQEHFERTRLLNLLRYLGPAEAAEKLISLPVIVKAQKAAREAAEKAAKKKRGKKP